MQRILDLQFFNGKSLLTFSLSNNWIQIGSNFMAGIISYKLNWEKFSYFVDEFKKLDFILRTSHSLEESSLEISKEK